MYLDHQGICARLRLDDLVIQVQGTKGCLLEPGIESRLKSLLSLGREVKVIQKVLCQSLHDPVCLVGWDEHHFYA